MHRGMDRIKPEAERKTVGVGLETEIGVGQEQYPTLGKEIDAQPRRPDDERGYRGFLSRLRSNRLLGLNRGVRRHSAPRFPFRQAIRLALSRSISSVRRLAQQRNHQ